jgi:hypothetical protein
VAPEMDAWVSFIEIFSGRIARLEKRLLQAAAYVICHTSGFYIRILIGERNGSGIKCSLNLFRSLLGVGKIIQIV